MVHEVRRGHKKWEWNGYAHVGQFLKATLVERKEKYELIYDTVILYGQIQETGNALNYSYKQDGKVLIFLASTGKHKM